MNWEMRVCDGVCGRSAELLRAAVKKGRRGCMVVDGGGGEEMERVGEWGSAKVAAMGWLAWRLMVQSWICVGRLRMWCSRE
jgi:hypothetical protein